MEEDLYVLLGISPDADEREIRSAYRNLAKKFHPDAGKGSSADRFRAVTTAYDTLSDPVRRREYDRARACVRPRSIEFARSQGSRAGHIDLRNLRQRPTDVFAARRRPLAWEEDLLEELESLLGIFNRRFFF